MGQLPTVIISYPGECYQIHGMEHVLCVGSMGKICPVGFFIVLARMGAHSKEDLVGIDHFNGFAKLVQGKRHMRAIRLIWLYIVWGIWYEHNFVVFIMGNPLMTIV